MIIGDNSSNNFQTRNQFSNPNQPKLGDNFENRWNQINEYNKQRSEQRNVFVKDIKEQHYANSADTSQMHDRTLALLHDRLQQGTISMEEFNRQCSRLSKLKK